MIFFELEPSDISKLSDSDLREMVARLCEAELICQKIQPSCVLWGGAQEAADGGVDVRVSNAASLNYSGFVPRENTGFQVKKNSMGEAACKKEMLDKYGVKAAISVLASKKGAYVIVSGKDSCSDTMLSARQRGMRSALESLPNKEDITLDFYGCDRLATWLRQFPGVALWVRSRLGKTLSGWKPFGRWAATPTNNDDEFIIDDHPCVIDLNSQNRNPISIVDGIKLTRERLRAIGSAVRITGLSGVGKTRFAQALFESKIGDDSLPSANVIYADLGNNLVPAASELITYLISNDFSICIVLDNCPPDVHRMLQRQISSSQAKLSLLTIEYDISEDRPEETNVVHLEPSSEKTVSTLVQKRFPELGRVNADKISEFSGGNARVAVALASRVGADETLANFSDEELFHRLFNQRKQSSDSLLESAEVLSLVYSFNVSESECNDELNVLSKISGLERRNLNRHHIELLRRQLSQKRGNWRAVLPHALANRLARRALQNISPDEINAELFKRDNLRLFKSCAHRLGYLHDFEAARQLACTWIQLGAPLYDIASCDSELLTVLNYIAPAFPDSVLKALVEASKDPKFCSRDNPHFLVFVRLLRKLAYDDKDFDHAAKLMLRFAETEKLGENNNSIVIQLQSLFSLYLSGTQATPARRLAFVNGMLSSGKPRHLEIARDLFRSAFQVSHWTSSGTFDFGARNRDYGWEPKTNGERLDWYVSFIQLLKPFLDSEDEFTKSWVKDLLANHFKGLWSFAGCFDILEEIVCEHASGGRWPEMWMSIKQTIYYDGKNHTSELYDKLKMLERLAAPSDVYSEIEAYVFTNTWDHVEVRGVDHADKLKDVQKKIVALGELAAAEPEYLEKLAPRLWERDIDSLSSFGKGLAKGSVDQTLMFEMLVQLMQKQKFDVIQPRLFEGFFSGVYAENPSLARQLQERVLEIPEMKLHFIFLLSATPIVPWGIKKLIELAESKEIESWRFELIKYGRVHEIIPDSDLAKLLSALNNLDGGIFSTIEILNMRFFIDKESKYIPNDTLRSLGRKAILQLVSMSRDEFNGRQLHGMDRVIDECLSEPATKNEICEIVNLLCDGIESYRLYSSEFEKIIEFLVKNYPEVILERVFLDVERSDHLVYLLFKDRVNHKESALNLASVDRIVRWCDGDQKRIQSVVAAVSPYTTVDKDIQPMNNPKEVVLSVHVKLLLDAADNKIAIVETIFSRTQPNAWSGSLAEILEVRSKAFSELLEYPSSEVREFAKNKLNLIEKAVRENREREAEEYTRREQRFE